MSCLHHLIDSHCHLSLSPLSHHIHSLLSRCERWGVIGLVSCGVCPGDDWETLSEIARERPFIRPQFGLHPWWIDTAPMNWKDTLREYLRRYPQAGVGECGIDKCVKKRVSLERQKEILKDHLLIAKEFNRPVTLHCVQSWGSLLSILQEFRPTETETNVNFILHSCNKLSPDLVPQFLDIPSVYFSLNGSIPFEKDEYLLAQKIPLQRLLIESDSPDQKPKWKLEGSQDPFEDQDITSNEPLSVLHACISLSRILQISPQDLADVTSHNSRKVYWFPP
jgi:TatD DNase family protein